MFSKKERVNRTIFPFILKEGVTFSSRNLSLRYIELKEAPVGQKNQYSFVVSAKVSKLATTRNLLKRRARYIIRKNSLRIRNPVACVFFFKLGAISLSFIALEEEIIALMSRAKIV